MPKTTQEIRDEIAALNRLAASVPDDAIAQASIAGQIDVLNWAIGFAAV